MFATRNICRQIQNLGLRLLAGILGSLTMLVATALLVDYLQLDKERGVEWLYSHGFRWLLDQPPGDYPKLGNWVFRLPSIAGFCLGALFFDRRLPTWLTAPLIGSLLGVGCGMIFAYLLDAYMAQDVVDCVYAPYRELQERGVDISIKEGKSSRNFHPSLHRELIPKGIACGVFAGLFYGLTLGLQHRCRWVCLALGILVTLGGAIGIAQYAHDGFAKLEASMSKELTKR